MKMVKRVLEIANKTVRFTYGKLIVDSVAIKFKKEYAVNDNENRSILTKGLDNILNECISSLSVEIKNSD